MNKQVRLILAPEAEEVYKTLQAKAKSSKLNRSIFNAIANKKELIKADFHYGDSIAKDRIPQAYRIKYGATNLFRVELPQFWRMLYTLTAGKTENEVVALILEISDHGKYDRLFGYKRK